MATKAQSLLRIFRIPAFLGLISVTGLGSGLVGDGIADWISWLCLGCIIGVCLYFSLRPKRHDTEHGEARPRPNSGQRNTNNS